MRQNAILIHWYTFRIRAHIQSRCRVYWGSSDTLRTQWHRAYKNTTNAKLSLSLSIVNCVRVPPIGFEWFFLCFFVDFGLFLSLILAFVFTSTNSIYLIQYLLLWLWFDLILFHLISSHFNSVCMAIYYIVNYKIVVF